MNGYLEGVLKTINQAADRDIPWKLDHSYYVRDEQKEKFYYQAWAPPCLIVDLVVTLDTDGGIKNIYAEVGDERKYSVQPVEIGGFLDFAITVALTPVPRLSDRKS